MGSRNTEQFDSELIELNGKRLRLCDDFINMSIELFSNPSKKNLFRDIFGIEGVKTLEQLSEVSKKFFDGIKELNKMESELKEGQDA